MDSLVLDALREAVRQDRAIRLVVIGKGRDAKGLFPKRTKPYGQAIKTCLDNEHGFLEVIREERKGKTLHHFVKINDRGLETLVTNLPVEEYGKLIGEAAPIYRGRLLEHSLKSVRERLGHFETQRRKLRESRERMALATLEFMCAYLGQLDEDNSRVQNEHARALDARNRLAQERADYEAALKRDNKGQATRTPPLAVSEAELDFQRDISEELVYAWRDAVVPETQDALARVLFNVGVERVGAVGESVEFDGRWQHTDDEIQPGNPAQVVRPGWRLVNQRGSYLIARALVKPASKREETPECPP